MSADFLFSFILFFQVQIESIKDSGFYKILSDKYPEIAISISDPQVDGEIQELINITGVNFDDIAQFSMTIEGLDGISNASQEGGPLKLGPNWMSFFPQKLKENLMQHRYFLSIRKNK